MSRGACLRGLRQDCLPRDKLDGTEGCKACLFPRDGLAMTLSIHHRQRCQSQVFWHKGCVACGDNTWTTRVEPLASGAVHVLTRVQANTMVFGQAAITS